MRKNHLFAVIVLSCAVSLIGCYHLRFAGPPCMGNACPSGTKGEPPAAQHADYQQPAAGTQQAAATTPAEPAAAPANTGQASAAPPSPAQANSAQAKPGRFTRLLETLHLHSKS
jgi:hypothetical protein